MTSPTDDTLPPERPRDRIWSFVLDRLASLGARAKMECKEPSCGTTTKDEDGEEVSSCSSVNCGEKLMMAGWRRELQVMRDLEALVQGLERKELQAAAAADKKGKRS